MNDSFRSQVIFFRVFSVNAEPPTIRQDFLIRLGNSDTVLDVGLPEKGTPSN
jgi:hypothetical protein